MIIGGGVQGCTVASFLLKSGKTTVDQLSIIDPHEKPLSNWKRMTGLIEMPYLRSPFVHHIDAAPFSLHAYGKKHYELNHFYGNYKRPSLELFNDHCDQSLQAIKLEKCWVQGRVKGLKKEGHWVLETEDGERLTAQNVVIAIGVTEQPHWPDWAKEVKKAIPSRIYHIFDQEVKRTDDFSPPFLIVGGGISAAHLAVKLSKQFPGQVTMVTRHPFRLHAFDSDPGWLGQKYLRSFDQLACFKERRDKIKNARNRGSLPNDVYRNICSLQKQGKLKIVFDEINESSIQTDAQTLTLELSKSGERLSPQTILLASGFEPSMPGKEWLKPLVQNENLTCAECGYPIVSKDLEWCPHLFVAGALAELVVGPAARNISGARMAAERIVSSI
nr:FAD/NAD(P)-binding protein [Bacillus ectoiniformans]